MTTWIRRDDYRYKVLTSKSDVDKELAKSRPDDSGESEEVRARNGRYYSGRGKKSVTIVEWDGEK